MLDPPILICQLHCHHLYHLDVINRNCSMIVAAASRDTLIISKTFLDGGLQYGEVPGLELPARTQNDAI